jgi:predicted membrane protein
VPVIRAHVGRRHAAPARVAPAPSMRKILTDALFWSISASLIAGVGYWSALQWVDVFSPNYAPHTITTNTHHITFGD